MIAQIYLLTYSVTRSIRRAVLVDEVEIDSIPQDQVDFAVQHGGDFIEIVSESDSWLSTSP